MTTARKWATSRSPKERSSVRATPGTQTGMNLYTTNSIAEGAHVDDLAKISCLFEPDALASAQYFDNFQRKTLMEPEKRLMMAILEDGVYCFQDNVLAQSGKSKKLFQDAEEWLFKEGSDWIFSFRNLCELLELDAEYLRAGLMLWKQKILAHGTYAELGSL
jgi:hypothetical protein